MWLALGRVSVRASPLLRGLHQATSREGSAVADATRALRAVTEFSAEEEASESAAVEHVRSLLLRSARKWSVPDLIVVLTALSRLQRLDAVLMQQWEAAMLPHLSHMSAADVCSLLEAVSASQVSPSPAFLCSWADATQRVMTDVSGLWPVMAELHRLGFSPPAAEWWHAFAARAASEMSTCPSLAAFLLTVAEVAPEGVALDVLLEAWEAAATERIKSFSVADILSAIPRSLRRLKRPPRGRFLQAWLGEARLLLHQLAPLEQWKAITRILRLPVDATGDELGELLASWAGTVMGMDLKDVNTVGLVNLMIRFAEVKWSVPGALSEKLLLELAERSWSDLSTQPLAKLGLHLAFLVPRRRAGNCAKFFKKWGEATARKLASFPPALRVELLEVVSWLRVDAATIGREWFDVWFDTESRGVDPSVLAACAEVGPSEKCAMIAEYAYVRAQLLPVTEAFASCVSADDARVKRALGELKRLLEKHARFWSPEQLIGVFFAAARNGFVGFHLLLAWQQAAMLHLSAMSPPLLMQCLDTVTRCLPLPPSDEFMRAWTQATRSKLEFEQKPWIVANMLSRLRFRPDNAWMQEFAQTAARNPGEAAGFVAYLMSMASIGAPMRVVRPFVDAWEEAAVERIHTLNDREVSRRIIGAYEVMRRVPGEAFLAKWQEVAMERLPRFAPEDCWALTLKLLQLPWPDLTSCAPLLTRLLESMTERDFELQSDGQLFAVAARLRDWGFQAPSLWMERVVTDLRRRLPNLPDRSVTFVANWISPASVGPEQLEPLLKDLVKASTAVLPSFVMYLLPSMFMAMERLGATPDTIGEEWFGAWLAAAGRHVTVNVEGANVMDVCRAAAVRMSAEVDEVIVAKALFDASQKMPRHDRAKVAVAMDCMRALLETRHASFPPSVLSSAFAAAAKLRRLDEELIRVWELAAEPRLKEMSGSELVMILSGLFHCRPLGVSPIFLDEWCRASAPKLDQLPDLWRVANLLSVLSLSPEDAWWQSFVQQAPKNILKCEGLVEYLSDVSNCFRVSHTLKPFLAAWERAALPHVFSFSQLQVVRWIPGAFERLRHVPSDAFLEGFLARALQLMPRLALRERWVLGERIAHLPFDMIGMVGPFLDLWARSFSRTELRRVDETPLMTVMWSFEGMGYVPSREWLRDVLLELTERMARFYSTKNLLNAMVLVSKLVRPPLLDSAEFKSFAKAWAKESGPRLAGLTNFSLVSALAAVVRVEATPEVIGSAWFESFLRASQHAVGPDGDLMQACREAGLKICPMDFPAANRAILPYALENMRTVGAVDQRVLLDWIDTVVGLNSDEMMRRNKLARALEDLEAMMDPSAIPPELVRMCKEAQAELAQRAHVSWKPPPPTHFPPLPLPAGGASRKQ